MGRVDPDSRTLTISNTNPDFPDFTCQARNVTVTEVKWYSYVLAGYLGIVERINSIPKGIQLFKHPALYYLFLETSCFLDII